jgi:hypothetical protein
MVLHKNGKPQVVSVKAGKKVSHGNEKNFLGLQIHSNVQPSNIQCRAVHQHHPCPPSTSYRACDFLFLDMQPP